MITTITRLLNELAELESKADVINMGFDERRDEIINPEIQAALDGVEADRALALDTTREGITKLQTRIKVLTIDHGKSVKADHLHAVYSKGRITWDGKGLKGYAVANPEINAFRKFGNPSASIRKIK